MPNIFKHFLGPVRAYTFPAAEDIEIEEDPPVEETLPEEEEPAAATEEEQAQEEELGAAASLLSFAQVQAEEIRNQARKEAQELLEESRRQAAQEAEGALAQAKEEGFRQGYADGMSKAQIEGRAAMEEQLHQQELQLKQFLEEASQAREDLMEQTQSELCDLSVAVAEKIIHVSLKSSREVILKMIQMATDRLKRREWVHIYVGGCTARELAQITTELTATLAGLSDHIKVIPMADDESGTCIIEMPDEIIDASVSTQLDNIKDILHGG